MIELVICRECDTASRQEEWERGRCPNPACYPGMKADMAVRREWERGWEEYRKERISRGITYGWNLAAMRETYVRDHPIPPAVVLDRWPAPMSVEEWNQEKECNR